MTHVLTYILLTAAFAMTNLASACPLAGKWDTGFVSSGFGHTFLRLIHEFDCNGKTKLTASQVRGKMLQPMAEVIERSGTYTLGNLVAGTTDTWEVDVRVNSIMKRYLDPSTVELAGNRSDCQPSDVKILEPFDMQGRKCDRATYSSPGQIERAVVRIDGDKLYWSFFHGENRMIVQKPADALQRATVVDPDLVFIRQ